MSDHTSTVHEGKDAFHCSGCDKTFLNRYSLRKHLRIFHRCPICDIDFATKEEVENHNLAVHEGKKPYQCSSCDQSFLKKDWLRQHINQVHEKKLPFLCSQCGFKARKKGGLKKHIETVHEGIKPIETPKQICSICGTSVINLKVHTELVHGDGKKPHECTLCEYKTATKGALNQHIKTVHEKVLPHMCHLCDYRCPNLSTLKQHIKTVHEKVRVTCDTCNATFSSKNTLATHIKFVHEGSVSFECSYCGFKFPDKQGLKRHVDAVHEKKNRKTCELCHRTYSTQHHLKYHTCKALIKKVVPKGKKLYQCPKCDSQFISKQGYDYHISVTHEGKKPFECSLCDYKTPKPQNPKTPCFFRYQFNGKKK